ncbi:putative membrane protein [Nocardia nova SH22a]|uniref:Putative membrane protein n=1 Tax=Nocardia nova SH22a TaxID=1415166 RepID=W5TM27_9NOCA|nr:putative membrane protein [Nocardia nova SH22a]
MSSGPESHSDRLDPGKPESRGRDAEPDDGTPGPDDSPELDYRFTLAGERTFLAWIRTALGLLAGGVAVHELVQPFGHHDIRSLLAVCCIVLAVVVAVGAFGRWRLVEAAMRAGRPLPQTVMVPILAGGIAVIAVLAGIGLLLS